MYAHRQRLLPAKQKINEMEINLQNKYNLQKQVKFSIFTSTVSCPFCLFPFILQGQGHPSSPDLQ
jgi:hypothetical protein